MGNNVIDIAAGVLFRGGSRQTRLPEQLAPVIRRRCRLRLRLVGFRFRGRTFFANGTQLDRAGGFAFLAPMALGAGEPFPYSAIVANKDFFSHAKPVSR